jgi:hypothetical protein
LFQEPSDAKTISSSIIGAFIVGFFVGFFVPTAFELGAVTYLKGFERWVTRNVDTDAIQQWILVNECYWPDPKRQDEGFYGLGKGIPDDLPECFTGFRRQYIYFKYSELDHSRVVGFEWGGPMSHWGIIIGPPNMKMPELMEEWYDDYDVVFRRILKPGVYVYSRG